MARWLDSLAAHVTANGLGTAGADLFVGYMDDLDQVGPISALAPANGQVHEVMGGNGIAVDEPILQLSVRAPLWNDAYDRAMAIRTLIVGIQNQTIQGTYFLRVAPVGTLRDVGRDSKNRQMFTVEFSVWM
jgi:hypothetical protein